MRRWLLPLVFLVPWCIYGITTNSSDVQIYNLYQMGAEALVDFHTFTLDQTKVPKFVGSGDADVFDFEGHKFAAKQPGAFVATAVPYAIMHAGGLNYVDDYDFIAAWTAWYTAGAAQALGVLVFFLLLLDRGESEKNALLGAALYAFGTTLFPYTGIAHHDVMATNLLLAAFFILERGIRGEGRRQVKLLCGAGFLAGLVPFFSMLPAIPVAAVMLYAVLSIRPKKILPLIAGFFAGNLPLAFYNHHYFHSWISQANVAGNFKDTFFHPTRETFDDHWFHYFSWDSGFSVTKYMPLILFAGAGAFFWGKKRWREQGLVIGVFVLHFAYLLNIQTVGHCQYGPRYAMPVIPFCLLGLSTWFKNRVSRAAILLIGAFGVFVNAVGAVGNTLYCDLNDFGPKIYFNKWKEVISDPAPLRGLCFTILALALLGAILTQVVADTRNDSSTT